MHAKGPAVSSRAALLRIPVEATMEILAMDVMGSLPKSKRGNRYLSVVSDYYTKRSEVLALCGQKATAAARVLFN